MVEAVDDELLVVETVEAVDEVELDVVEVEVVVVVVVVVVPAAT